MIPVTLLDVHITGTTSLDFGANPGSSLRGALYETLRTLYDDGSGATSVDDDANPVAWLLRIEDKARNGGKDIPRPLALRPPLTAIVDQATFSIVLYGHGQAHLPMLISALSAMGRVGVGRNKRQFTITGIEQRNPATDATHLLLDHDGKQVGELDAPPTTEAYLAQAHTLNIGDTLTVNFLTPMRIIRDGRLTHKPIFSDWVRRLLSRTIDIGKAYTDPPPWVPMKDLLPSADSITLVQDDTDWKEAWSGSRRTGKMKPTSGFVGQATYQGDFEALLPWLVLGQALQAGKHTIKGNGWYTLVKPQ